MSDYVQERDGSSDEWICPHCGNVGKVYTVEGAFLKSSFQEMLIECDKCEELHIRKYKFKKIIKLEKKD